MISGPMFAAISLLLLIDDRRRFAGPERNEPA